MDKRKKPNICGYRGYGYPILDLSRHFRHSPGDLSIMGYYHEYGEWAGGKSGTVYRAPRATEPAAVTHRDDVQVVTY